MLYDYTIIHFCKFSKVGYLFHLIRTTFFYTLTSLSHGSIGEIAYY